jgi:5-methylcytosine-specific restriction endonuclease McrA
VNPAEIVSRRTKAVPGSLPVSQCGVSVMSVDFVVPRARKGKKVASNLVTACRPCNLVKGRRVFKSLDEEKTYVKPAH